jgi:hypothetical protein
MKKVTLLRPESVAPPEPVAEVEKPLPPPPPQMNKPVGDPPAAVEAPEGFDAIFAMALRVRGGKPGMADFWARMAQAEALNRIAGSMDRLNEFLGVRDEEPAARLGDAIADGLVGGVLGSVEELLPFMPEEQRKQVEAVLSKRGADTEE